MAFNPLDANAWTRWAQDFDNTSRLFADQFNTLQRLGPYVRERHPEMVARYNTLIARGAQHQATLSTLQRLRADVGNWLRGIGRTIAQVSGATMDWLRERFGLGGLAVAPIVAIAGVAAAAAALTAIAAWIRDAFEMSQRLNALYRLESQGLSPTEAANVVNQTLGMRGNIFGIPWQWLIAGAIVIALGPPLLNMIRERRA